MITSADWEESSVSSAVVASFDFLTVTVTDDSRFTYINKTVKFNITYICTWCLLHYLNLLF